MTGFEAAFQKGARVIARRAVALKINKIERLTVFTTAEKMIVRDFEQGRARSKRGDVAAQSVVDMIGVHDHRHGVPPDVTLDLAFELPIAGIWRGLLRRDRVDVRRGDDRGDGDARLPHA